MSTQVYFNRPGAPWPVQFLIDDITRRASGGELWVASAWFTHMGIARAIVESTASYKTVIVNAADVEREGDHRALDLIRAAATHHRFQLVVLGDAGWREGIMHHKFVVILPPQEDVIAWFGSANLTHQALKNYETIVRMEGGHAAVFWGEAQHLACEADLWNRDGSGRFALRDPQGTAQRCEACARIIRWPEDWDRNGGDEAIKLVLDRARCRKCDPDVWVEAARVADEGRERLFDEISDLCARREVTVEGHG